QKAPPRPPPPAPASPAGVPHRKPALPASSWQATGPPPAGPPPWKGPSAAATSLPRPSSAPLAPRKDSSKAISRPPAFRAFFSDGLHSRSSDFRRQLESRSNSIFLDD